MKAPSIFACYRRDDLAHQVDRIVDDLRRCFGFELVFKDNDHIAYGSPWPDSLRQALEHSTLVLVFIGEKWHNSWDSDVGPRLWYPRDWVRTEICKGLADSRKKVIPVLFDDVPLPKPRALPSALRKITSLQTLRIRRATYPVDIVTLTKFVGSELNMDSTVKAWLEASLVQDSQSMYRTPPVRMIKR
jgi:hypothetical protein